MTAFEVRPLKIILRVRRRRRASSENQKYPVETQKVPSSVHGYLYVDITYFNVLLTNHAHYICPFLKALPHFENKDCLCSRVRFWTPQVLKDYSLFHGIFQLWVVAKVFSIRNTKEDQSSMYWFSLLWIIWMDFCRIEWHAHNINVSHADNTKSIETKY